MASVVFVLNEGPYGSERSYNALRHAMAVSKQPETEVRVFLMADATTCALAGQKTPEGYYSIERMLKGLVTKKAQVALWGTCMDARGLASLPLVEGARRGSMDLLSQWTLESDKVIVYWQAGSGEVGMVERIDPKILEMHAKVCKTMAHPLRLALLNALRDGERSVNDLAEAIGATQPLVSQHLGLLRNQGLLRTRRSGNEVYYGIAYPKMVQACDLLRDVLFEHLRAQEELARLETPEAVQ